MEHIDLFAGGPASFIDDLKVIKEFGVKFYGKDVAYFKPYLESEYNDEGGYYWICVGLTFYNEEEELSAVSPDELSKEDLLSVFKASYAIPWNVEDLNEVDKALAKWKEEYKLEDWEDYIIECRNDFLGCDFGFLESEEVYSLDFDENIKLSYIKPNEIIVNKNDLKTVLSHFQDKSGTFISNVPIEKVQEFFSALGRLEKLYE